MSSPKLLLTLLAKLTLFATLDAAKLDIGDLRMTSSLSLVILSDLEVVGGIVDLEEVVVDLEKVGLEVLGLGVGGMVEMVGGMVDLEVLGLGVGGMVEMVGGMVDLENDCSEMISSATSSALTDSPVERRCSTTACTSS